MKKKINSWSEYEKFKISQDIAKYFGEFFDNLKSKLNPKIPFGDLLGLSFCLFLLYILKKGISSKIYEKKNKG